MILLTATSNHATKQGQEPTLKLQRIKKIDTMKKIDVDQHQSKLWDRIYI
jgi:hypothetical protein